MMLRIVTTGALCKIKHLPRGGAPDDSTVRSRAPPRTRRALHLRTLSLLARTLQRTLPAGFIAPCLPIKTAQLPSGRQWLHEIKHDGFRIIVRNKGPQVRLYSRPCNDLPGLHLRPASCRIRSGAASSRIQLTARRAAASVEWRLQRRRGEREPRTDISQVELQLHGLRDAPRRGLHQLRREDRGADPPVRPRRARRRAVLGRLPRSD